MERRRRGKETKPNSKRMRLTCVIMNLGGVTYKKIIYHVSSTEGILKYLKLTEIYLKRGFIYYILEKIYRFE